ncbi:DUF1780 domain-containing protein [Teredinibacter haidensis]|uniref:DUF1780 domain-containing protein n=1 Tax=Teredinibacter haidensis TaxID=2731755 RepID=UPI0009F86B86|nr:DUF1780 domain-containing protein [Teredinibacter haidensis]
MNDEEFITERVEAMEESVRYYSADKKAERERWVASTFLENLNISHSVEDIINPDIDPPDAVIFGSDFEIKEILDFGRKRHKEYKKELERIKSITDPKDLFTMHSPKDMSIEDIFQKCVVELEKLDKKYPKEVKESLNLLFYVNLQHICHIFEEPFPNASSLKDFGWKSVSFIKGKIACSFYANEHAPKWIKDNVGRIVHAQC